MKEKITGQTSDDGIKIIRMMVPLKYLSNFWRNLEMPLIDCEINLDLNLSENCIVVAKNADQDKHFQ